MTDTNLTTLPESPPLVGEMVLVRSRKWLVESVVQAEIPGQSARVSLACAEDDSQGELLEVYWD